MGLTIVAETIANNCTRADTTGADDLLAKFGLSRLYEFATTNPPQNPYLKLKQAIDRRLYKGERWSLASVADWPAHHFQWHDPSVQELRRAFPLAAGAFDLQEEERGVYIAGAAPIPMEAAPSVSEGPSLSTLSEVSGKPVLKKIKIKAKRPHAAMSVDTSSQGVVGSGGGPQGPETSNKVRGGEDRLSDPTPSVSEGQPSMSALSEVSGRPVLKKVKIKRPSVGAAALPGQ